jgi:hypothetical protein
VNRLFLLAITVACLLICGVIVWRQTLMSRDRIDALIEDPWYLPASGNAVPPKRVTREQAQKVLPFALAIGPGHEIKVEIYQSNWWTSRITYRVAGDGWYRIVQYPQYPSDPPISKPIASIRGRAIYATDADIVRINFVSWRDPKLGEVELASNQLASSELVAYASSIIDKVGD